MTKRFITASSLAFVAALATPAFAAAPPAPVVPVSAQPRLDIPAGRLSQDAMPGAYRLDMTIDPTQERFSGQTEIDVTLAKPTPRIMLHGRDLNVSKAEARVNGRVIHGAWRQVDDTGVAALFFDEVLPAGKVTLALTHDAAFGETPSGMYRVKVGDDWYSWTQFESIDARAAFPSFDDPQFKTPYTVTIRTPAGLKAVSNAPEASVSREGALDVHRFAPTLPLPSYLVAMVTGPLVTAEGAVPPTPQRATPLPIRIVSTKPNAGQLSYALENTKPIVALLEKYFDDSFPYPKLDQITSPVMPGAMENAGADIYADTIISMDEKAPVSQKRAFGMVVAHELAHQWFGDLVTPVWWDDIWLNESFANWMGFRIGNEWKPELGIGAGALSEGFFAMSNDMLLAGRPIRQDIARNDKIDAAFDTITYGKGGHVVAMIAAFMGDDKFRDGVRRYMKAHRYGNATRTEFFGAMADVAGDPRIVTAMQSFTDQQGVPLLTFAGKNGRYTVTQSPAARFGTTPPARSWGIPMCLRKGDTRNCSLMTGKTAQVGMVGKGPLVPNAGGAGYYLFDLPKAEWNALIAAADTLPDGEALATQASLEAVFRGGGSNVGQLAALARKLARNPSSSASDAALSTLGWVADRGLFDASAKPAWRRFARQLRAPLLAELGFDPRAGAYAGEDPDRTARRTTVVESLAATARDPAVRATLAAAAAKRLAGDESALDPMWEQTAFTVQVEDGGLAAAKTMVEQGLASTDERFRMAALLAPAASGRPEVARWLLDELNDKRLRVTEKRYMLGDIVGTSETEEYGYQWLKDHLAELTTGNSIFFMSRLPGMVAGFCSVERAEDIAATLRPRLAKTSGALELERAIERVRNCGKLKAARGAEITAAVKKLR